MEKQELKPENVSGRGDSWLLSVIIPVYKVEKYLQVCVDSVLAQKQKRMQIILVDDGSPDQCPEICDAYAARYSNIQVIHKANGGLSSARNAGLLAAKGKYVMFLDSDDWWDKEKDLFKLLKIMEDLSDIEMLVFGSLDYMEDRGITKRKDNIFFEKCQGFHTVRDYYGKLKEWKNLQEAAYTKIFRREFLMKNRLFFQVGILGEDTEWMFRTLRCLKKVYIADMNFYIYRYGRAGAITNMVSDKNLKDIMTVIRQSMEFYKENLQTDTGYRELELGHCAYLWLIALSMCWKLEPDKRKQGLKELRRFKGLIVYGTGTSMKIVAYMIKILGITITSRLLYLYSEKLSGKIVRKRKQV